MNRLYEDYPNVVQALGGRINTDLGDARREAAYHLSRLGQFARSGRFLDLGCGRGDLLLAARGRFEVYGVDISPHLREEARDVQMFVGRIEDAPFKDGFFDAAAAIEVIEHLFDPRRTMRKVNRILAPHGVVLLQTGDASSFPARLGLDRWMYLQPPVHLNFFSREGLARLLKFAGFRILRGWSFGRAPQRIRGLSRLSDSAVVRPILDFVAGRGLIGQVHIAIKAATL